MFGGRYTLVCRAFFVILCIIHSSYAVTQDVSKGTRLRGKRQTGNNCGLLGEVSEEAPCYINNIPIPCPASVVNGVIFVKRCRPLYTRDGVTNSSYLCENGKWTLLDRPCRPECGIKDTALAKEKPGENPYPWVVSIFFPNSLFVHCTGSIISAYHVLTGADCAENFYDRVIIIADRHFTLNLETSEIRRMTKKMPHPNYSSDRSLNNIAVLEVDRPFNFSSRVHPVCIDWDSTYEKSDLRDGKEGESFLQVYQEWTVKELKVNMVQYREREVCENDPDTNYTIHFTSEKYCALVPYDGEFEQWTQPGGGMFFKSDGTRYYIRGILNQISTKRPTSHGGKLVYYTRISNFLPWLKQGVGLALRNIIRTGCILPNHIQHGIFQMPDNSNYIQNILVPISTIISLSCTNANNNKSYTGDRTRRWAFVCVENRWYPPIYKTACMQSGTCPSIEDSLSEKVSCHINGAIIDCGTPEDNTTAIVRCQPFYTFESHRPIYKCQHGKWDQEFSPCTPECGIKRADNTIVEGKVIAQSEYPWVVSVYGLKNNHVCGGSMISQYYVLSAAQCFTDNTGQVRNKEEYFIVAGKYHQSLNTNEPNSQKRTIKSLVIHEDYGGNFQLYRYDLALIELEEGLTLSINVQPVCLDWYNTYEEFDFRDSSEGITVGWRNVQEEQPLNNTQIKLPSVYWSKRKCLQQLPDEYSQDFLRSDKLCLGYKENNISVTQRHIGSGLYFQSDGKKFYIRGVASTTIKSNVGDKLKYFTMYTKVSKYIRWIETKTKKL